MRVIFHARRSICWGWRVSPLALRIVNDVWYVMRTNNASHFSWQAQYLVMLVDDTCCSAYCKWRFICDDDQSCASFYVAGAVLGDVGGWHLLLRLLYMTCHMSRGAMMRLIFRGRHTTWRRWWMAPVAPRIVNDVSYLKGFNHESHFWWQAQYLVRLEGHTCCSAYCTGRFMRDQDQPSEPFFVAGAIFGEVQRWLLLLRALYWAFHLLDYQTE